MVYIKKLLVVFLMVLLVACTDTPRETYTITFHTNGGNELEALEYESGESIVLPDNPTKSGYVFEAWYTDEALTGLFQSTEMPPFDIDLYAKWDEDASSTSDTISVTYLTMGGSTVPKAEYLVGDRMVAPPAPTKSGYEFRGWSTTQFCNSIYSFGNAPDDDLILYACWREEDNNNQVDDITISFNSNGGTTVSSMTVTPGDNITAPSNPTKSGYSFGGWYTDSNLNNLFTWGTAPSSNVTLYAKWIADTVQTYTVTFDSNGGSTVSSQTIEDGQTATEPTDPTRNGYTFDGWYINSALTTPYNFSTAVSSNMILYAKWIEEAAATYTVTFQTNGGSSVSTQTVEDGQRATKPTDPTKDGYAFDGWYLNSTLTTAYNFTSGVSSDITLYAKWTEVQTNTAADVFAAYLLQEGFTCSNNVCVLEDSWDKITIDLNNVTFKYEYTITDDDDPNYYSTEILTIYSDWDVDFRKTKSTGSTSARLTGNVLTETFTMVSFSSAFYEEAEYYDDMVATILGQVIAGVQMGGLADVYENYLTGAGITLDDLT
jgi:uncharacterized repeat protein (TIGR02543 family)